MREIYREENIQNQWRKLKLKQRNLAQSGEEGGGGREIREDKSM